MPQGLVKASGGAGPTVVTWSPTQHDPNVTLSPNKLVATAPLLATQGYPGRTDVGAVGSKNYYFELIVTQMDPGQFTQVGVGNSSMLVTAGNTLGFDSNLTIGFFHSGAVEQNSTQIATIGSYSAGSVLGFAINPTLGLLWERVGTGGWLNDILANQNPATNTGGLNISALGGGSIFPAYVVVSDPTTPAIVTAQFALASFTNAAPAGYHALGN
jgi:hypothetical protein